MKNIICSKCKKAHSFSSTIDFGLTRFISNGIMDGTFTNEQSERWMIISQQYYLIKGLIELPVKGVQTVENLSFLVWVMVSKKDFIKYMNSLEENLESNYEGVGKLTSEIQYFEETTGLEVIYKFRGVNSFPKITIRDLHTNLGKCQFNGLSKEQVIQFTESLHHYDGYSSDDSTQPQPVITTD